MKTVSVRLGFATNSSSAHSVISGGNNITSWSNSEIAEAYKGTGEDSFGWEEVTHDDVETIINYGLLLFIDWESDENDFSEDLLLIVDKFKSTKREWCGIDHQSGSEEYGNPGITTEKEDLFWDFIRNTSEIIGGNDNN